MKNKNKAIILMLISALAFAIMTTFVKLSGDLPSIEKSFFRNLISLIIATFIILKSKDSFFGKSDNRKALLLRSALGTLGIIANYYAIDHLLLADANMLNKLSPFFVIIFSYIFLKEKITFKSATALIVAFLGSLLIIKPSFSVEVIPYIIGVLSALFAGSAYTCVRYLGGKEKGPTIVFFFSFFSIVSTFPFVVASYEPIAPIQFLYLILAGSFAAIAQFSLTSAYKYAPARDISIYDYSQIIFSAILGFILFDQIPDELSLLGYLIIIGSSIYIFIQNKKEG